MRSLATSFLIVVSLFWISAEAARTPRSEADAKYQLFVDKLHMARSHILTSPVDRTGLNYLKWDASVFSNDTPILYLPGRGEDARQWAEVAHDMWRTHHFTGAAYVLDHRGQGDSPRLAGQKDLGHVEEFSYYVEDLHAMIRLIQHENRGRKPLLMAHSMGGAILMKTLLQYPGLVEKAVLITPMFDINLGKIEKFGEGVAGLVIDTLSMLRPKLAVGAPKGEVSIYNPDQVRTSDAVRAEVRWRILQKHGNYMPRKTMRWVGENLAATEEIYKRASEIQTDVLVFAAENDHVVEIERMIQVSCQMPNCKLIILPDAYHAAHEESDRTRAPMLQDAASFWRGQPVTACDQLFGEKIY